MLNIIQLMGGVEVYHHYFNDDNVCVFYFDDSELYFLFVAGLVGASVKQKLVQTVPRCRQTARSLIQLHRRDPSNWLTYQHLNFLKRQVMPVKSDLK